MSLIQTLKRIAGIVETEVATEAEREVTPQMKAAAERVFAIFQEHQGNPAVVAAAGLTNGMHPDEIAVRVADAAIRQGLASIEDAQHVQTASGVVNGQS